MAKGIERLAYKNTLLSTEVRTLRAANKALSKRRRAKKTRIRQGGALTVEDAQDIIARKEAEEEVRRDVRMARGSRREGQLSTKYYRAYRETSYNVRTYQDTIEVLL